MARPAIAEHRREEILVAFESCVLRKGLDATTLTDVANEAGLPRSLVRYFMGNRNDMVDGLIDRIVSRSFKVIPQALAEKQAEGEMSEDAIVQTVMQQVFFNDKSNRIMIQLWLRSNEDQELKSRIRSVYSNCVDQIAEYLYGATYNKTQRRRAYALAAMALGHAAFSEFDVGSEDNRVMTDLGLSLLKL